MLFPGLLWRFLHLSAWFTCCFAPASQQLLSSSSPLTALCTFIIPYALLVPRSGPQFLDRGPSHVKSRYQVPQDQPGCGEYGLGRFRDFCSSRISPQAAGVRGKTALSNSKGETCGHHVANPVTWTFSVICSSLADSPRLK